MLEYDIVTLDQFVPDSGPACPCHIWIDYLSKKSESV